MQHPGNVFVASSGDRPFSIRRAFSASAENSPRFVFNAFISLSTRCGDPVGSKIRPNVTNVATNIA